MSTCEMLHDSKSKHANRGREATRGEDRRGRGRSGEERRGDEKSLERRGGEGEERRGEERREEKRRGGQSRTEMNHINKFKKNLVYCFSSWPCV